MLLVNQRHNKLVATRAKFASKGLLTPNVFNVSSLDSISFISPLESNPACIVSDDLVPTTDTNLIAFPPCHGDSTHQSDDPIAVLVMEAQSTEAFAKELDIPTGQDGAVNKSKDPELIEGDQGSLGKVLAKSPCTSIIFYFKYYCSPSCHN